MNPQRFALFDVLATPVVVLDAQGAVLAVNAALEDVLGVSRRNLLGLPLAPYFVDPYALQQAMNGLHENAFATLRFEAELQHAQRNHSLPVHVVIGWADAALDPEAHMVVEMLPVEQKTRQEREERWLAQAQGNKELIRNLAHEIKNPLGGIRGAAQLLELELPDAALTEYTQVIIREADRLQVLVDRLLAPHRRPHVVEALNIHEVCERVRAVILAEFSKGLEVVRDYDTSIPELRGDKEQLIQAVLNIAHNAAQALAQRRAQGDARLTLRTRILRQVTLGKQRHRLALQLEVIDNGPGIAQEIKDRVFSPLVSARAGGSGLGLTLAQTFVQQHQGVIECTSEPGCTNFSILIPLP